MSVVVLLYHGFFVFLKVFAEAVFLEFLEAFYGVAADVAHGDFGVFGGFLGHLGEVASAFLGEGWDHDADHLAVVVGVEAEVGGHDCFLDVANHGLFPGSYGDGARVWDGDVGHLVEWCGRAEVVDFDVVEHVRVGFSGSDFAELIVEMLDGFAHLLVGVVKDELQFFLHNVLSCCVVG